VLTGPAGPEGEGRSLTDAEGREGSILLMSGVDSSSGSGAMLEIDPTAILGWTCESTWYFSYAGPGDGQPTGDAACPVDHGSPYGPEDTLRPVEELVGHLEAFVSEMPPPVVVTGHSQGAWLVWEAAATGRLPGAEVVVLVGAFPENRVWYPAWGERAPGAVGRMVLDAVVDASRFAGTSAFEPDSPLGRELLGHPDAVSEILARPLPEGVRALSVASAFDLPLLHGTHRVAGATDACPVGVVHPNLPYAAELQGVVAAFVDGDPLPPCPAWRTAVGPLLRHFTVPPSPPR
jgi:pimeloyl-ACP methyl ester carboxylesterase